MAPASKALTVNRSSPVLFGDGGDSESRGGGGEKRRSTSGRKNEIRIAETKLYTG